MDRKLQCPELEMRHTPFKGSRFHLQPAIDTSIDLLEIHSSVNSEVQALTPTAEDQPSVTYQENLSHDALVRHFEYKGTGEASSYRPLLRILFIKGKHQVPTNVDQFDFQGVHPTIAPPTAEYLIHKLGVSPTFLTVLTNNTWVSKTGNCKWIRRAQSEGSYLEGWYRYSCGFKGAPSHVWFSYHQLSGAATYIVNNCEQNGVQDSILRCVREGLWDSLLRPLAVDAFVAEAASEAWGNEALEPRVTLAEYERLDGSKVVDTAGSIRELHVLLHNLHVIKDDLVDLYERMEFLLQVHTSLDDFLSVATDRNAGTGVSVQHSLSFLLSQIRIRQRWIQNYTDRTSIQIHLVYNLSSQKDNLTNLRIAEFTSKIATETQKDSSSMITMAIVTMFFLPGTFVSALFSMTFFEVNSNSSGTDWLGSLSVSPGWWLYPAITVPLTILVFVIWNTWRLRRNHIRRQELQRGISAPTLISSPYGGPALPSPSFPHSATSGTPQGNSAGSQFQPFSDLDAPLSLHRRLHLYHTPPKPTDNLPQHSPALSGGTGSSNTLNILYPPKTKKCLQPTVTATMIGEKGHDEDKMMEA